jgi:hypothetical protein
MKYIDFELITRRSLVQIRPPPPDDKGVVNKTFTTPFCFYGLPIHLPWIHFKQTTA